MREFDTLWYAYTMASRDHFEVWLRMHPMALRMLRDQTYDHYFNRIDTDAELSPLWVDVMARVA